MKSVLSSRVCVRGTQLLILTRRRPVVQFRIPPFLSFGNRVATPPAHQTFRMAATLTPSTAPEVPSSSQTLPGCYPEYNPVDTYRAYISTELSKISGVDAKTIYPLLSWTTKLENGDLALAVPALRNKALKPEDLAKKWSEQVCISEE